MHVRVCGPGVTPEVHWLVLPGGKCESFSEAEHQRRGWLRGTAEWGPEVGGPGGQPFSEERVAEGPRGAAEWVPEDRGARGSTLL